MKTGGERCRGGRRGGHLNVVLTTVADEGSPALVLVRRAEVAPESPEIVE
jgi:hypothetical protein